MHVIRARNVCEALLAGVSYLLREGLREDSRNGPVIVAPGPVTTVYERSTERVLSSPVRDANPFFHLAEALWMLAGRDDARFLNLFVRDFGARFADGEVMHGAYGHRWRRALGFDQLDRVVEILRNDRLSRQAVIQMWDARTLIDDLYPRGGDEGASCDDLLGEWKDRPCNTHAYLRVRGDRGDKDLGHGNVVDYDNGVLDMLVSCRSNDVVWGAYGANAVHFSVLQEYLAARIGVGVGPLWQTSWNYHAYVSELSSLERRSSRAGNFSGVDMLGYSLRGNVYESGVFHEPLVSDVERFDTECARLLELHEVVDWTRVETVPPGNLDCFLEVGRMANTFLVNTAWPLLAAHGCWRARRHQAALGWLGLVRAQDWREAGREWLDRRRA